MSLPVPNLDDRDFQSIVDDAKRLIPRFCPEWTNHNVSDPGVALIELFAWMSEYMLFRLNQVPDVFYTRMLNLLGEDIFPATAARTNLTFWLLDESVVSIPAGTEVATLSETEEPIVFATLEPFDAGTLAFERCRPPSAVAISSRSTPGCNRKRCRSSHRSPPERACISGSISPLAGSVLDIEVTVESQGIGVDPTRPPLLAGLRGRHGIDATVMRDTSGVQPGWFCPHRHSDDRTPCCAGDRTAVLAAGDPCRPRTWATGHRSVPAIRSVEPHRIAVSVPAEHSASVPVRCWEQAMVAPTSGSTPAFRRCFGAEPERPSKWSR